MTYKRIDQFRWEIPIGFIQGMRVPGLVFADEDMMKSIAKDGSLKQVANAATLPGAVKASLAMPDIHYGYGFPIGGVLATRVEDGVISPGGVGFDINCGVRLLSVPLHRTTVQQRLNTLINQLFSYIPTGVGSSGKLRLKNKDINDVLHSGSEWAVTNGYGTRNDLMFTETFGKLTQASADFVSKHAKERGRDQLGTLGSGNHFIEVQVVEEIYDPQKAEVFNIEKDGITVMIHSGSRGLGHQVCTDYLRIMTDATRKYRISLPDRQLACAPLQSEEGQQYLKALQSAANFAWANRQCLMHWVREVFYRVFDKELSGKQMPLVYDVAHNIVKLETHEVDSGKLQKLAVHRKGATRAFAPGNPELPEKYIQTGQPVIIPGDMGTASYILTGTHQAMKETFGSTCHGAGRILSRKAAKVAAKGRQIANELESLGIIVKASGRGTIVEEMPDAYKDIDKVISIVKGAGLANVVAKMRPLGVIKG